MAQMIRTSLSTDSRLGYTRVEQQARQVAGRPGEKLTLIAWWDSSARTGGPREACADETIACVSQYAAHHGASYHVHVNNGQYDFFYGAPSADHQELVPELVEETHRDADTNALDNVQGG
jgi:hypothetical protein